MGYSPQGHKQSDTTELTEHTHTHTHSLFPRAHFFSRGEREHFKKEAFPEHTSLAEENVNTLRRRLSQSTLL